MVLSMLNCRSCPLRLPIDPKGEFKFNTPPPYKDGSARRWNGLDRLAAITSPRRSGVQIFDPTADCGGVLPKHLRGTTADELRPGWSGHTYLYITNGIPFSDESWRWSKPMVHEHGHTRVGDTSYRRRGGRPVDCPHCHLGSWRPCHCLDCSGCSDCLPSIMLRSPARAACSSVTSRAALPSVSYVVMSVAPIGQSSACWSDSGFGFAWLGPLPYSPGSTDYLQLDRPTVLPTVLPSWQHPTRDRRDTPGPPPSAALTTHRHQHHRLGP